MGYAPRRQSFTYLKEEVGNIIAGDENPGGYYILGAHFDTVAGTPGADDNASGVAVLLEVARLARNLTPPQALGLYRLHLARSPRPFPPRPWAPGFTPSGPGKQTPRSWACSAWRWWDITPRPRTASRSPCP